jgi:ATP-dependent RNA helicase RhlE
MSFQYFNLSPAILRALQDQEYITPTPIQQQAIPVILENRDLLGCAQTGTGKTAAFSLPMLERLHQRASQPFIKALVLAPTRELALQIGENIKAYSKYLRLEHVVIFGGVSQHHQVQQLRRGVDIVVATPGRLLDLINQGIIKLNKLEMLVLDEADRMFDMGFINDIRKIVKLTPTSRQTLLFSATMPPEIQDLAMGILKNPVQIRVTPVSSAATTVNQSVYFVEKNNKRGLLQHVIREQRMQNVLVFTRTKRGADRVAVTLNKDGISAAAIHGDKSQQARQKALQNFKNKSLTVLVATDIAARGIDVDDLSFVINYELPNVPETYVHRIGRTGRAGASGSALSFCDQEEKEYLVDILKVIKKDIDVVDGHPFMDGITSDLKSKPVSKAPQNNHARPKGNGGGNGNRNRRGNWNTKKSANSGRTIL